MDWSGDEHILTGCYSSSLVRTTTMEKLAELVGFPCGHITYSPRYVLPSLSRVWHSGMQDDGETLDRIIASSNREFPAGGVSGGGIATIVEALLPEATCIAITSDPKGYGNLGVSIFWPSTVGLLSDDATDVARMLAVALLGSVIAASHRDFAMDVVMLRTQRSAGRKAALPEGDVLRGDYLERLRREVASSERNELLKLACDELDAVFAIAFESDGGEESLNRVSGFGDGDLAPLVVDIGAMPESGFPWHPTVDAQIFPNIASLVSTSFSRSQRLLGAVGEWEAVAAPYGNQQARFSRPAGVLIVGKRRVEGGTAFGVNDLVLVRSLSVRMSRSSSERRWFGIIARLAERVSQVASPVPDKPLQPSISKHLASRRDAKVVAPLVNAVLNDLITTTGALSATCRIVVGLGPTLGARSLARLAYAGSDSVLRAPGELEITAPPTDSVNAWVAWNGVACYLREIPKDDDDDELKRENLLWDTGFPGLVGSRLFRSEVRSELCVPVFAEGRLVATINLESAADRRVRSIWSRR